MEVDFTEKIKSVFDVCDAEGTGYITVDHLKDLARDHFGADSEEATVGIIQLLDPEGRGKINFQDFSKGVQQILEVQAQSKVSTPTNPETPLDFRHNFPSFPEDQSSNEAQDNSQTSAYTFNEYDTTTDEDGGQLLIDFTSETPRRNLFPSHGHSSGRSSVNSRTDEENFEDFGVVDLESDSSDANLSCDSCHRSRRSSRHRHRGPNRRVSSAAYARTLSPFDHQSCPFDIAKPHVHHLTKGVCSPSEDIYDDIDGSFQELTDRIKTLEHQLVKVSEEKTSVEGIKHRYKDENHILIKSVVDRMHTMEEQLKDMETRSGERLREEQRKYHELVNKSTYAEQEKMDYLTVRLQTLETDNDRLKTENSKLKHDNEKQRSDRLELSDRLLAVTEDYNRVSADYEDCKMRLERQQVMSAEGDSKSKMMDELQKELEDLRIYKIECERRNSTLNRSHSLSDSNGYSSPMQAEMARLKESCRNLKEENEELSAQLLAQTVREGKHMLQEGSSLADELDHLTKEELLEALKKEQEANFRIRQYLDKLIITILEKNPSMLEIH